MPERVQDHYSKWVGFIFIFNLIVGTGALTLPSAFARVGWMLGTCLIIVLAFMSYLTATYVIETMACANAVLNWRRYQLIKRNSETIESDDYTDAETDVPLTQQQQGYYSLTYKIELGEITELFFNHIGRVFFYVSISVYLFGDLAIYSAAVAKSMKDIICTKTNTSNITDAADGMTLCWEEHSLTRFDVYRLCLVGFIVTLGPFAFCNVQKTKYLQIFTGVFRWLAFSVMISLAVHRICTNANSVTPETVNIAGVPFLIGTCIYSFMCHHSFPSLLTPIANKKHLKTLVLCDFMLIVIFYITLALTAVFAFTDIKDLYTLNFIQEDDRNQSIFLKILAYFLALFPVFTLSASFPIVAITLKNNLQTIFLDTHRLQSYNYCLRKVIFPILTIVPPICVTMFTENVSNLVGFTGGYGGAAIQYLIPIALVYSARRTCRNLLGNGVKNDYASPFKSNFWIFLIFIWTIFCVILVSINFFKVL